MQDDFQDVYVNDGGYYYNRLLFIILAIVLISLLWFPVTHYITYKSELREVERVVMELDGYDYHETRYDDVKGMNMTFVYLVDGSKEVYWFDDGTNKVERDVVLSYTL